MECDIVIRTAKPQDKVARTELIARSLTSYDFDAIVYFVLQELMLQLSVLCGAVLFIFGGAGLGGCALVPLALALVAALAVLLTHRALAQKQAALMRREDVGFVAEYRGPLGADPRSVAVRLVESEALGAGGRLVATVSLSEFHGPRRSGWLHGLAVDPRWQRRGIGSALLSAVRAHAGAARLESLEGAASSLQGSARALLHAHGWELRGTYHRQLLGAALTLPMLQLGLDLPHA